MAIVGLGTGGSSASAFGKTISQPTRNIIGDVAKTIGAVANTGNSVVRLVNSLTGNNQSSGYSSSVSNSYSDPNNALTYQWMQEANAFNAAEAEKNRKWQEMMSNTAYQRAMADMEKAGLNPILAANNGGASTPGGDAGTAVFTGAGASVASNKYSNSAHGSSSGFFESAGDLINNAVETAKDIATNYARLATNFNTSKENKIMGYLYGLPMYNPYHVSNNKASHSQSSFHGSSSTSRWSK